MATPFAISLLPKTIRGSFSVIEAGVARGLSGNAITNQLRAGGLRVSATSVNQAVRLITRTNQQAVRTLRGSVARPIPVQNLPVALSNIKRDFSYRVSLSYLHPETGSKMVRNITVSTSRTGLTKSDILQEAADILNDNPDYEAGEVIGGEVLGGVKSVNFQG